MSDEAKIRNSKLTAEQSKLIYDSLSTNIIRFQEYRLDIIKPDGAVLFEYLCYNSYRLFVQESTANGFFYHSYERIDQEYGIGKDRVKKIVAYLKRIGVVETKVCGFPKNTHYRIRFDLLASPDILKDLFRGTPTRLKALAAHYSKIAAVVKLRPETTAESLEKQYPSAYSWFALLKRIFYKERERFNRTISAQFANRKVQPSPREATLRAIEEGTYLAYFDYQHQQRSDEESAQWVNMIIGGFRLYCALYFYFTSGTHTESIDLEKIASNEEADYVYNLANYASGIRDPIAYFFANHDSGAGFVATFGDGAARDIDFTVGYFIS